MPKCDKLLERARKSPANVRFTEICQLAECYGFVFVRQEGSHRIYKRDGWPRLMNFQDHNGKAVTYQVRQLLNAIDDIRA
jgi:predicted RNA binding protein YcfA (HicA-like mRNA interferase family)